jgi:hypothetical protein
MTHRAPLPLLRLVNDARGERIVIAYVRCPVCLRDARSTDPLVELPECDTCETTIYVAPTMAEA